MTPLVIQVATIRDLHAIVQIGARTFFETYAEQNEAAAMEDYLAKKFNEAQITSELVDVESYFFLAKLEEEVVGYIKLKTSKKLPQLEGKRAIEIERIYVLKAHHKKKIGAALMQYCLDFATQNGFETIWLGVWPKNPQAIQFYERWGFEIFGTHLFFFGGEAQEDFLMKKELNPNTV